MPTVTPHLSIGQVAERTGASIHTLRFYENEGLMITPVRRSGNGHRQYTENDVDWLNACLKFRDAGMTLPQIRRYVELIRAGDGTQPQRLALLREHGDRLRTRIGELHECLDLIDHKARTYQEQLESGMDSTECIIPGLPTNRRRTACPAADPGTPVER